MKSIAEKPDLQIWVCVNERAAQDSLPSCTLRLGNEIYQRLCTEFRSVSAKTGKLIWVNRTLCQGFCHSGGVTLSAEPFGLKWQGVTSADVSALVALLSERLVSTNSHFKV